METLNKNLLETTKYGNTIAENLFSSDIQDGNHSQKGGVIFRKSAECIYGTMQAEIPKSNDGNLLKEITYSLYKEMFEFVSEFPGFNFVRMWNYVPHIVKETDQSAPDIEVYRCFNAGRFNAFQERYGEDMQKWQIPAATAVGAFDNVLHIEFFASSAPSIFFENKIQVPAYQYSLKYGKLPPVFSRGAICELKNETLLLISGTASVVKEDTAHVGDISGQINQTFRNIHTLINRSNLSSYGLNYGFDLEDLIFLRVFYKNESDKDMIEIEINKKISKECRVCYINTDICRDELVIEIEGVCSKKTK